MHIHEQTSAYKFVVFHVNLRALRKNHKLLIASRLRFFHEFQNKQTLSTLPLAIGHHAEAQQLPPHCYH